MMHGPARAFAGAGPGIVRSGCPSTGPGSGRPRAGGSAPGRAAGPIPRKGFAPVGAGISAWPGLSQAVPRESGAP